jgi:hypothetical protein
MAQFNKHGSEGIEQQTGRKFTDAVPKNFEEAYYWITALMIVDEIEDGSLVSAQTQMGWNAVGLLDTLQNTKVLTQGQLANAEERALAFVRTKYPEAVPSSMRNSNHSIQAITEALTAIAYPPPGEAVDLEQDAREGSYIFINPRHLSGHEDEMVFMHYPPRDEGAPQEVRVSAAFGNPYVASSRKFGRPSNEQIERLVSLVKGEPGTYKLVDTSVFESIFDGDKYRAGGEDVMDSALVHFDAKAKPQVLISSISERFKFGSWNEYARIHATPASQPNVIYLCVGLLANSDATQGLCPVMRYDVARDEHRFATVSRSAYKAIPRPEYEYQEVGVLDNNESRINGYRNLVLFDYDKNATSTLVTLPVGESLRRTSECFGGDPVIGVVWIDSTTLEYAVYEGDSPNEKFYCDQDYPLLEKRQVEVTKPL